MTTVRFVAIHTPGVRMMDSPETASDLQRRIHERNFGNQSENDPPAAGAAARPAAATPSSKPKSQASSPSTREQFSEGLVPAQFKLPRDLVASLKLHSIQTGRSMSEIVLDALTSQEMVAKAWISVKKSA